MHSRRNFKITVINGPNLNMLGAREPNFYGKRTLIELMEACKLHSAKLGNELDINVNISFLQNNSEGELINYVQSCIGFEGVIINGAGYSHTSIALMDSVRAVKVASPQTIFLEVHLSNVFAREDYRKHSYLSEVVDGVICGLKETSYIAALEYIVRQQNSASAAANGMTKK